MGHPAEEAAPDGTSPPPGRLKRILRKAWWFHSFFALSFGVGVMLFARAGLQYADKVLMALMLSWLLMFVALRFIVGPTNRKENEKLVRKGVRVATNYVIKQFYQQMFFFLTPLYASSATWSLSSWNWWLAPVLLVCAVVSTMDLVFDNFIMERRLLAAAMYGLAMFGVLNVMLPLVAGFDHFTGLVIAAVATPASVAILSFRVKQVLSPQGAFLTITMTGVLLGAVWFGRSFIPPAPLAICSSGLPPSSRRRGGRWPGGSWIRTSRATRRSPMRRYSRSRGEGAPGDGPHDPARRPGRVLRRGGAAAAAGAARDAGRRGRRR